MELFRKQICRTCMIEVAENERLCFIYDTATDTEDTTIADLLKSSIPRINIKLNDELPKSICTQCLETVLKIERFQKMCLKSELEMLALIEAPDTLLTPETFGPLDMLRINDCFIKEEFYELKHATRDCTYSELKNQRKSLTLSIKEEEQSSENDMQYIQEIRIQGEGSSLESVKNIKFLNQLNDAEEFIAVDASKEETTIDQTEKFLEEPRNKSKDQLESILSERSESSWDNQDHSTEEIEDSIGLEMSVEESEFNSLTLVDSLENTLKSKVPTAAGTRNHKPGKDPKDSKYSCNLCGKVYKGRQTMVKHVLRIHKVEPEKKKETLYECLVCTRSFVTHKFFLRHTQTHTGTEKFFCDVCDVAFTTLTDLIQHKKIHPFKDVCKKIVPNKDKATQFVESTALQKEKTRFIGDPGNDIKKIYPKIELPLQCKYCTRRFRNQKCKKKHEISHSLESVFKCKFCGKSFGQKCYLNRHLLKFHKTPQAIKAPVQFTSDELSRRDFTVKRKEFSPNEDMQLLNAAALEKKETSLMDKHGNNVEEIVPKKPQCKFCGRSFVNKKYMSQHEITHTLGKQFKCNNCAKTFVQKSNLNQHILKFH